MWHCLSGQSAEPPAFPLISYPHLIPPPRNTVEPAVPLVCSPGPLVGQTGMHLPFFLIQFNHTCVLPVLLAMSPAW